jgi:hypothetical protein
LVFLAAFLVGFGWFSVKDAELMPIAKVKASVMKINLRNIRFLLYKNNQK